MVLALVLAFVPASIEDRSNRLLIGGVVGGDVEQVVGGTGLQAAKLVDQGLTGCPERNALMTSASMTSGRELHRWENLQMYSRRDSLGSCWQHLRSQEFPGRTYVPWKFSTKTLMRSAQSRMLSCGRNSSHARTCSPYADGEILNDEKVIVHPLTRQVSQKSSSQIPRFISPVYLAMLVGGRKRCGNDALRICRPKARGPRPSGLGLQSSGWRPCLGHVSLLPSMVRPGPMLPALTTARWMSSSCWA